MAACRSPRKDQLRTSILPTSIALWTRSIKNAFICTTTPRAGWPCISRPRDLPLQEPTDVVKRPRAGSEMLHSLYQSLNGGEWWGLIGSQSASHVSMQRSRAGTITMLHSQYQLPNGDERWSLAGSHHQLHLPRRRYALNISRKLNSHHDASYRIVLDGSSGTCTPLVCWPRK